MNVAPFLLKFSTTLVPEYSCSCRSRPETLLTLVEPGQRASPPPDEGGGLGAVVGGGLGSVVGGVLGGVLGLGCGDGLPPPVVVPSPFPSLPFALPPWAASH